MINRNLPAMIAVIASRRLLIFAIRRTMRLRAQTILVMLASALNGCTTISTPIDGTSETSTIATTRGVPVVIDHATELRRDCSILSIPTITVTTPPVHGRIEVYRAHVQPTGFSPNNPRYKCRLKFVEGTEARYVPEPDFRGQDTTSIRIGYHYGEGERRQENYADVKFILNVK